MIVQELIDKLKDFPPQTKVLGRGYESGWSDIEDIELIDVLHIPDGPWYDGDYQAPASYYQDRDYEQITAVTIS